MKKIIKLSVIVIILLNVLMLTSCTDKHTHKFNGGRIIKEATCCIKGIKEYKCSCGETKQETINKLPHNYVEGVCSCGERDLNYQDDKSSKGLEFKLNSDEKSYSVVGIGVCREKDIIIPETYDDLPVTNIGNAAFFRCRSLESIRIPSSVTSIGQESFRECTSLESIEIPSSVIYVGNSAFENCPRLIIYCESKNIPDDWHNNWNPDNQRVINAFKGFLPIYSTKEFTLEGFVSYTELESSIIEKVNELIKDSQINFDDSLFDKLNSCLYKEAVMDLIEECNQTIRNIKLDSYKSNLNISNYKQFTELAEDVICEYLYHTWEDLDNERLVSMYEELITDVIKECIVSLKKLEDVKDLTAEDLELVTQVYEEISAADITLEIVKDILENYEIREEISNIYEIINLAKKKMLEVPTKEEFIKSYIQKQLGYDGKEPTMENGNYAFYFDKKWTTFKIVDKKTGNVWYSNPQEKEDFNNSSSVLQQQKSLLNIYYAGGLGGTTMWNSYTYSISDTDSSGEKELAPNFQIKEIKDANGKVTSVQVYYFFEQRNIDYVYFPKFISSVKVKDPASFDLTKTEELPELYARNKTNTTDGKWEEVVSLKAAASGNSVKASDNTVWFAGNGVPGTGIGYLGTYYVDLSTSNIYVKTNQKTYDSGQNGLVSETVDEYWKLINTTDLTWEAYSEKNYTYNNLVNKATVFEYAYSGNGAPVETDGLNGFYYYDATNNTMYKKTNGTQDYTYLLSMKEMFSLCRTIYGLEDAESESNTRGYDFFSINNKYEGMALGIREKLYSYLYDKCSYTEEDLVADNSEFGVETVSTKGKFGIAMEYTLNENGLQVTILKKSIFQLRDYPILAIGVLPNLIEYE